MTTNQETIAIEKYLAEHPSYVPIQGVDDITDRAHGSKMIALGPKGSAMIMPAIFIKKLYGAGEFKFNDASVYGWLSRYHLEMGDLVFRALENTNHKNKEQVWKEYLKILQKVEDHANGYRAPQTYWGDA